jgi:hypothetical protein
MRIKKRGPLRSRVTLVTTAAALALFLATPQSGMCYLAVEDSLRPQTRPNSPVIMCPLQTRRSTAL